MKQGSGSALLSDVASPAQARVDAWNRIRESVERIAAGRADDQRAELEALFRRLEEVERFWVYPGPERIERLRQLYRAADVPALRARVNELVDGLSERGDRAALAEAGDHDEPGAHYFTVLLVDTMNAEQLRTLRRNLLALRLTGPSDLVYEVLLVGSFEEAWLAVMCNPDIQAVVMRHSFPVRAARPLSAPAMRVGGRPRGGPAGTVPRLHQRRAGAGAAPPAARAGPVPADERVAGRRRRAHGRAVHAGVLPLRIGARAAHDRAGRRARPDEGAVLRCPPALRRAADRQLPRAAHCARPLGVQLAAGSATSAGSTATTCSWPSPAAPPAGWTACWSRPGRSSRRRSLAARCFGAQRTFFVTNGTSTANKIVHMALLRPGDVVLIDRNCHKSHHYGLTLAGARPVYLDAYSLQPFAIYGGVPLRTLKQALLDLRRDGPAGSRAAGGADQRHLRRHRLPARARDGGAAGHPPRPLLPVGRGLVRLRPLPAADAPAHRHGRGRGAERAAGLGQPTATNTGRSARRWGRGGSPGCPTSRSWSAGCCPIPNRRGCACTSPSPPTSRCPPSARPR